MKKRLVLISTLALAGLLPGMAAAGHSYKYGYDRYSWAEKYASIAVEQAQEARAYGCDFHGSRWTRNYEKHYYWALKKSKKKAKREMYKRRDALERCKAYYDHDYHNDRQYRDQRYHDDYSRRGSRRHDDRYDHRGYSKARVARDYADTAIRQLERARELGCHVGRSRWTSSWEDHYSWGLRKSESKLRSETEARQRELDQCEYDRGRSGSRYKGKRRRGH